MVFVVLTQIERKNFEMRARLVYEMQKREPVIPFTACTLNRLTTKNASSHWTITKTVVRSMFCLVHHYTKRFLEFVFPISFNYQTIPPKRDRERGTLPSCVKTCLCTDLCTSHYIDNYGFISV